MSFQFCFYIYFFKFVEFSLGLVGLFVNYVRNMMEYDIFESSVVEFVYCERLCILIEWVEDNCRMV